jgi:hypothetical protein
MKIDTRADRLNLYRRLTRMDIITKLKPMLRGSGWIIRPDGKIDLPIRQVALETPWVHSYQDNYNECTLWHSLVFDRFRFWPTYCMGCWKVVAMPPTLEALFDLYEYQKEYGKPCKCGIEIRSTVNRLYGGYFYNRGKEAGQAAYEKIRKDLDDSIGLILKCGCSEFELGIGPAEDWEVTDDQLESEDLLRQWVVIPDNIFVQPPPLRAHVMLRWIHWAYEHGDETYKLFTNNKPLTVPMRVYHKEEKENGEVSN